MGLSPGGRGGRDVQKPQRPPGTNAARLTLDSRPGCAAYELGDTSQAFLLLCTSLSSTWGMLGEPHRAPCVCAGESEVSMSPAALPCVQLCPPGSSHPRDFGGAESESREKVETLHTELVPFSRPGRERDLTKVSW